MNQRNLKDYWFEDNFDLLSEATLEKYKNSCRKVYKKCPDECLLSFCLLFPSEDCPNYLILLLTMKHFTRQKPLGRTEWTDNFGLNNLCFAMALAERETEENKNCKCRYTVKSIPFEMNPEIKFDIDDCFLNLVMPVKIMTALFILDGNCDGLTEMFQRGDSEKKWKVLDLINQIFPNYFAGAHGCNCFQINKSCSYETLIKFLLRYPSSQIGAILNTSRYGEAGEHWTSFTIRNNIFSFEENEYKRIQLKNPFLTVCFCCSFGSTINSLHQDLVSDLQNSFNNLTVNVLMNTNKIQNDDCNCGVYSALFIYILYQFPGQLKEILNIKEDAKNIILGSIFNMRIALIGAI